MVRVTSLVFKYRTGRKELRSKSEHSDWNWKTNNIKFRKSFGSVEMPWRIYLDSSLGCFLLWEWLGNFLLFSSLSSERWVHLSWQTMPLSLGAEVQMPWDRHSSGTSMEHVMGTVPKSHISVLRNPVRFNNIYSQRAKNRIVALVTQPVIIS